MAALIIGDGLVLLAGWELLHRHNHKLLRAGRHTDELRFVVAGANFLNIIHRS